MNYENTVFPDIVDRICHTCEFQRRAATERCQIVALRRWPQSQATGGTDRRMHCTLAKYESW